MKLKQFYLALSVATVLSACSNEDNLPPEPVDAYISLSLSSQPTALRSATKAGETTDKEGTAGEKRITEVATLLFDNAGMLVAFKDTVLPSDKLTNATVSISEVNNIHVKVLPAAEGKASDTKFKMVVVANSNDLVKGVAKLDDLKKIETPDITDYTPEKVNTNTPSTDTKYLPMISGELTVSGIIPEKQNMVGDKGTVVAATTSSPIIVTRRVARVQLDQLTVKFTDTSYGSFTPDSFFVVNVRKNSLLMSATGSNSESIELTSAPFIHGGPANGFVPSQGLIDPSGKYETGFGIKAELKILNNDASTTSPIFQCYVYENQIGTKGTTELAYDTRLIISGEVKLATGQSLGKRYFHIPLQDANGVKVTHNTIYKVNATISGEGSPKIDELLMNAWINYNIKVENWNVINQDVTDIN